MTKALQVVETLGFIITDQDFLKELNNYLVLAEIGNDEGFIRTPEYLIKWVMQVERSAQYRALLLIVGSWKE